MSEEVVEYAGSPVSLVQVEPIITEDLGRVAAVGAKVVGKGGRNNTRWIFDLVAEAGSPVVVQLLEHQSGRKLSPDKLSPMICPTSEEAWEAQPYITQLITDEGNFAIHSRRVLGIDDRPVTFSVRVSVDTIHTAIR